jgi:hypothetical protein
VTVSFFDVVDFQCCLYLFCVVELSTIWSDTFDSCSPLDLKEFRVHVLETVRHPSRHIQITSDTISFTSRVVVGVFLNVQGIKKRTTKIEGV